MLLLLLLRLLLWLLPVLQLLLISLASEWWRPGRRDANSGLNTSQITVMTTSITRTNDKYFWPRSPDRRSRSPVYR
jgi:hypothetical protein